MTARKVALPLPSRTPAFVSRAVGAAELCISPETWDRLVASGVLPPADTKLGGASPRWQWAKVIARLSGRGEDAIIDESSPYIRAIESFRAAPPKVRRHVAR